MNTSARSLGVIFGNRDFFPDALVVEARVELASLFQQMGLEAVMLGLDDTRLGCVETHADAERCAALFRRERERLLGTLVVLPNFGGEKDVSEAIRLAGLDLPVLVQAYPDDLDRLDVARRRDSFCGKVSVCNNLRQAGIPFSLTRQHVVHPLHPSFRAELSRFLAVCRVVRGLRRVRLGAVGARPAAFNTVRYSEKILERHGISVTTLDLSEALARAAKLESDHPRVIAKLEEIKAYAPTAGVPSERLVQMARLGVALGDFAADQQLDATAVQCWDSLQKNHGCNACTSMSMMSASFVPSACEVDVTGALTMYALQLAAGSPSALVDWNNNYGGDDDKCVLFHCGNWPKTLLPDVKVANAPILGTTLGIENTFGALDGRAPAGPLTFARITTDDCAGAIRTYVGEGELTDDPLLTFGSRAVARVPKLQQLLRFVCTQGFEHHVAMNPSRTAGVLAEAFGRYLGWEVYHHEPREE